MIRHRIPAHLVMFLAVALGGGSLLLFGVFLFAGPVVSVRLHGTETGVLVWDAFLSLLFFAQHSLMVRTPFKEWLARWIPRDFHAAVYAIASGVVLAAVILLWQTSAIILADPPVPARWVLRILAVLAVGGFVWGVHTLRVFDPFGRRPIQARLEGRTLRASDFVVRGPYRWVRHPLYSFMLVLIWANPQLSVDRALFDVLWTAWIVLGSYFEERDLVAEFGETYRRYQHAVPMLLPWRGPVWNASRPANENRPGRTIPRP